MQNIGIKSADSAARWQKEVEQLNRETYELLKDLGNALVDIHEAADSSIADELVEYGNNILSGTNTVLEGMNSLVSAVTNILTSINDVIEEGKGILKNIIGAVTGL